MYLLRPVASPLPTPPDLFCQAIFHGNAPEGFPRANPTLLDHPVQTHPEPRVGFTWQLLSSRDMVLRAGYGIFANRTSFEGNGSLLSLNPPFALNAVLNGAANATASLESPFPNLPSNSSFPNFVANMLPGAAVYREQLSPQPHPYRS